MQTQDVINYYANLLILQYIQKPKAYASVQAVAAMAIADQMPLSVEQAFDIKTAVGAQLDVVGKYAGVSRYQYNFTGAVTLSDDDYRVLIQIKVAQNNSNSDLSTIQSLLKTYFAGVLQVFDYQDMTMSYFLYSTAYSQNLAQVFVKSGLLPRPMGVNLRSLIYVTTSYSFFGMRTYGAAPANISPFNSYSRYSQTAPWLSYANGITS